MTATIDRMVKAGLIERRSDPTDRRGILAVATSFGYDLYVRAHARLASMEYGLAGVDPETVSSLLDNLDRVAAALEKRARVD
jgi:DNA-binding MarR family transcriptional regulator